MKKFYLILSLVLLIHSSAYCWNALGHRLVAQIAYNHLTEHAKRVCIHYNHALDRFYRRQNLIDAAAWLDNLRDLKTLWLQKMHYISLPFSLDGTKPNPPHKINAISAVEEARAVLQQHCQSPSMLHTLLGLNRSRWCEKNDFNKGLHLRILLHVVGDIHQPMHAINQFSAAYPQGDKGGNLFQLGKNPIASNLHSYWDKGGGYLSKKRFYAKTQLRKKARSIERLWPCDLKKMSLDPKLWAQESHEIAIHQAYRLKPGQKPNKRYQYKVKRLTEERIALAGCRLAALLNKLAT